MKPCNKVYILFIVLLFSGCAYYNTFFNAKQAFNNAEKERKKREKTQIVELSAEEKAQLKKKGQYYSNSSNRASTQEMQEYQVAIEKSSKVLEFYPKSKYIDDALDLIGKSFYYRREYKRALRKFEEIIKLYPESDYVPEARLYMAKTLIGLEEFEDAEQHFRQIINDTKIEKRLKEEAKYELAGLYYERENYEQASQYYKSSAKEADDKLIRALSLYRLGECLIYLKQFDEAPEIFKKTVDISPNEDFKSQSTFKLGEAQSLNNDYENAIKTFRDLLSKEYEVKRIPNIKFQLAENLRLNGQLDDAIKWYDDIIELHKRTDASARSYFSLGEIEEFTNLDYKKAKENYDMVRGEFVNSIVAPKATERAKNIGELLDLSKDIAVLEGREVESDSLNAEGDSDSKRDKRERDNAPIDLDPDGIWINYADRDRPAPLTLQDRNRMALNGAEHDSTGNSVSADSLTATSAEDDSLRLVEQKEQEEKSKKAQLATKYMSLAELLNFHFEKPDTALTDYQMVVDLDVDSSMSARAIYSMAYIYENEKKDTNTSDSLYQYIIEHYPSSPHAKGAKRQLNLITEEKVDSAKVLFTKAEKIIEENDNINEAFDLYSNIIDTYPDSPYAAKAAFARGWYFENSMFNNDSAKAQYEFIVEKYPETPYAKNVQIKLDAIEEAIKAEEARKQAIADSLASLEKAKSDSLAALASDSLASDSLSVAASLSDTTLTAPADSLQAQTGTDTKTAGQDTTPKSDEKSLNSQDLKSIMEQRKRIHQEEQEKQEKSKKEEPKKPENE